MDLEIWVGFAEVRQLPGTGHEVTLRGKGAFTWITCWANELSYEKRAAEVMNTYGLFIVDIDNVMPFTDAENQGLLTSESLIQQCEDTRENENFCIFGTLHSYRTDN